MTRQQTAAHARAETEAGGGPPTGRPVVPAYFTMWRCGATMLADSREETPPRCPDHPNADRLGATEYVPDVACGIPRGLFHDPVAVPAAERPSAYYVGTADSSARGANVDHLVADEATWTARCGKHVATARLCPVELLPQEVTCRTCRRALAT